MAYTHDFTWTDKEMADMIHCFDSDGDGKVNTGTSFLFNFVSLQIVSVYTQNQGMVKDEFGVASGVNTHRMKKKRTMF